MRDVILRASAERDIDGIADFTIAQWGRSQARRYVDDLRRSIEQLATTGKRHPAMPEVRPGLHRMRCGNHLVFYLLWDHEVDVIRILHERMDIERHLD